MIDTTPLNEQIMRELKSEILTGKLKPGQKLMIEELSKRWNVSSTPIRDAIRSLEASGFVIIAPRKSIVVSKLDQKAFKNVFDLRIALECLAVELSIKSIPDDVIDEGIKVTKGARDKYQKTGNLELLQNVDNIIHLLVLEYCDNEKLVSMMDDLHDLITWARSIVVRQIKSYEEAAHEHVYFLECLKSRNTQMAVLAMRTHLTNSCQRTLSNWVIQETKEEIES